MQVVSWVSRRQLHFKSAPAPHLSNRHVCSARPCHQCHAFFLFRRPAILVSNVTLLDVPASVDTYLDTGLACNTASQVHHCTADFVAHTRLALLHSGSSAGRCACGMVTGGVVGRGMVTCRVSCAGSNRSSSASSCRAGVMAGAVRSADFLLGSCGCMASSDRVGRVFG